MAIDFVQRGKLNALKANWTNDPGWDIETTPGFEAFHDELLAFRQQKEAEWALSRAQMVAKKADELGITGNTRLAEYVLRLEAKVEELDRAIFRALNPNP